MQLSLRYYSPEALTRDANVLINVLSQIPQGFMTNPINEISFKVK